MDIKNTILDDIWAKQFGVDMSKEWIKKNHLKKFQTGYLLDKEGD
jgi:hypothetical protein